MTRLVFMNRFFHPDQSATSRMLTDLARHLAPRHPVTVLCSRQLLEDASAELPPAERWAGVDIVRLWTTRWGRAWLPGRAMDYLSFLASAALWSLLHLRRGDTVIAKTDPPFLALAVQPSAALHRCRVLIWHQDIFPETAWRTGMGRETGPLARILGTLRRWSVEAAALNVAISDSMAAFLQRVAPQARVAVAHNWSDDFPPGSEDLREELNLGDRFVVGYSGNLGRAHPIEGLLGAAERLRGHARIHFLFSGGGSNLTRLKSEIAARSLPNWTLLPYQPAERLPALLRTADLHLTVLDSALEGLVLPSKLYGVLSAGRPVLHLGDPGGEIARILAAHGCGWTVPAMDAAGISTLLERLAQSDEAQAAATQARAAYTNYSRDAALARWSDIVADEALRADPAAEKA